MAQVMEGAAAPTILIELGDTPEVVMALAEEVDACDFDPKMDWNIYRVRYPGNSQVVRVNEIELRGTQNEFR